MPDKKQKPTNSRSTSKSKQSKVSDLTAQVAELREDVRRERADFMNYKRRVEIDRSMLMSAAKSEVIQELLPVFDDLERAFSSMPKDIAGSSWTKGLVQVYKQLQGKMDDMGIKRIEALGSEFNPNLHEAIGFEDGGGSHEVVIEELRPGYKLDDEVLRPSMVKVGKVEKSSNQGSKDIEENHNNNERSK
ncbi:MAG: nucleotide exchange factor GrpE [Candidatus Saccharimonadales bacterium]